MKILLSPAKKMNVNTDDLAPEGLPVFMEQTEEILQFLQGLSYGEAKKLWACNDRIAEQNYDRLKHMDLCHGLTPAILSYEGIAYQYMAPAVFESGQLQYVQEHLRILSAFYGVVKPLDGVTPYRLEMQAKAKIGGKKDLYEYWGGTCTGRSWTRAGSSSIWRQKNIPGVLRNICSRRMCISPASSVNFPGRRSCRKACMPRWPEARWCGIWRRIGSGIRRR